MKTAKVGDRVRKGDKTGELVLLLLPVRPLTYRQDVPDEALCRVRWDGTTFSVIEDARELEPV